MSTDSYDHIARNPEPNAPLVFAFHGTGGDEHQFEPLVNQILPRAGLVAPRGDVSEQGAARFFRRQAEGIYDMEDLKERTERMAAFVRAYRARHPETPAIGLGYSNGANILAAMVFRDAGLFDRLVLMHPLIPWTPEPNPGLAGTDVLITAGERDPICPWDLTEALITYFRAQDSNVSTAIQPGGHEISSNEVQAVEAFLRSESGKG